MQSMKRFRLDFDPDTFVVTYDFRAVNFLQYYYHCYVCARVLVNFVIARRCVPSGRQIRHCEVVGSTRVAVAT